MIERAMSGSASTPTTLGARRARRRVTVAPLTSTVRGVASEVTLGTEDDLENPCAVNLHNFVTVPKEGRGRRLAQLDEARLGQICGAIAFALGCRG